MSKKKKDLKAIARRIRKFPGVHCGRTLGADVVEGWSKFYNFPLPEEFKMLVSEMDGFRCDDFVLYSLNRGWNAYNVDYLVDLLEANEKEDPTDRIVIGENLYDYLVYFSDTNYYALQDREDGRTVDVYATLADVLERYFCV